jgi:uncharacterized membrane protein
MSHRLILRAAAIVSAIFGIALAVAPNQLAELYQAEAMNYTGVYNSMLFGGFLIGLAVMDWAASAVQTVSEARHVILGNLVSDVAALAIALDRQLTQADASQMSWINVAIFLVFGCLFGYLYFSRQTEERSAGTPISG